MKGVQCYELFRGIPLKNLAFFTYLGARSYSNWTFYKKICNSVTNVAKVAKINLESINQGLFSFQANNNIHTFVDMKTVGAGNEVILLI